ncbi:Lrp/AsnC family transcriptional regulator [Embleya sp. NPDC055664]
MDDVDRGLLALLQADATRTYADLGREIGLSAGATHERVRKLRAAGVIRRTTVDVDPAAVGLDVLAFVTVDSVAWIGDSAPAFAAITEIQEAHVVAGTASVLLKVRTTSTGALQDVLRRIHAIAGVSSTQATIALDTFFERPPPTDGTPAPVGAAPDER